MTLIQAEALGELSAAQISVTHTKLLVETQLHVGQRKNKDNILVTGKQISHFDCCYANTKDNSDLSIGPKFAKFKQKTSLKTDAGKML